MSLLPSVEFGKDHESPQTVFHSVEGTWEGEVWHAPLTEGGTKVPCSHSDDSTWEGEVVWHAAPLLRRAVQSPPSVNVSIVMKALGSVKSSMQHPSYGGKYKRPCFHSDEGNWEGELEGEAIHMEGGNIYGGVYRKSA